MQKPPLNYMEINVPEGKSSQDYNYKERRAEILQLVLQAGHPDAISRTEMGKRYGVSHTMIVKDMKCIAECLKSYMGIKAHVITNTIYYRVTNDLMKSKDNRDKFNAGKLLGEWNNWLFATGQTEKVAEKIAIQSENKMTYDEAYKELMLNGRMGESNETGNKGNK